MIRTDMDDVSDEEFFRVVSPCEEMVNNYVKDNFFNQYIAFHIAVYYIELVKKILEETYELKITSESPLEIEDVMK